MLRLFSLLLAVILLSTIGMVAANASMFGASGLDQSFCKLPTFRQTIVYIDDTMMQPQDTGWVSQLEDKLRASLTPGEKVAVIALSPLTATSAEIWSACWPDYSFSQKAKLAAGNYLFTTNPLDELKTQQGLFIDQFLVAITKIYNSKKDALGEAAVNAAHPPEKAIISALSSDSARYSAGNLTNRIIVYTDLAENSTVGDVFDPIPQQFPDIGDQLGLQFNDSIFYFFGVGEDVTGFPDYLAHATSFWKHVIESTGGAIGGIGSNLDFSDAIPILSRKESIDLVRHDQHLSGTLDLLTDSGGNLVDSWLNVTRLSTSSLSGTFNCENQQNCSLHAKTNDGITILNVNESLDLTGSSSLLTGTIGVPGSLVFPVTASSGNN